MKKHTEDFKREAVRIALSSGLSRRRVASDLGVGLSRLGKWVCEYRPFDVAGAPQADLARENERLRLENRVLKEERDILKRLPRSSRASGREPYSLSLGSYGRPGMTMELKEAGLDVGERRVGRLMKLGGIRPVRTRKHKVTTNSNHNHNLGIAPNLLDGDFAAAAPNQKWAGDIRYIWTHEGWLYLALVLDLHSRRVIGWAVSDRMKQELAIRALDVAVNLRRPPKSCIFHSDRGSQYAAYDYQKKLQKYELVPSMGGKGKCYDNASVETFFKSLKAELIWRQKWLTRRQAETAIFQYINGFYNTRRRHSYPGGISPLAFETKVA
jgi:putative transposase